MQEIIRKISKGTRFNQIYLKKNEGFGFEPGKTVIVMPVLEVIKKDSNLFEYNVKLNNIKKEIAKKIFENINESGHCENILITGSFLEEGFDFNDIDIIIIDSKGINEKNLKEKIEESIGIKAHLIFIEAEMLNKGIERDPLFRLMIGKYVSVKRIKLRRKININYKLLDAYLVKDHNLIDCFDILSIRERMKLLRDFIGIKLFSEGKNVSLESIKKEIEKMFGRETIEKLFYYGDISARQKFLKIYEKEFKMFQNKIIENAAKQK